jgi:hypothetical protein
MPCLTSESHGGGNREEEMSLIPMIVWKLIGILLEFSEIFSRLKKWLEISLEFGHPLLNYSPIKGGLIMEQERNTINFFFQGQVGFRNIMNVNWKSISRFSSFFLPCVRLSVIR